MDKMAVVEDLDFSVLVLRIWAYALLFLPYPSYILDNVRGIPLTDIRRQWHGQCCVWCKSHGRWSRLFSPDNIQLVSCVLVTKGKER